MRARSAPKGPKAGKAKAISAILAAIMLVSLALPAQMAFADPIVNVPTAVTGRVLTPDKTGDTSDWIEIARNGDYSLIVRKDFINVNASAGTKGIASWQYIDFGTNTSYASSNVRTKINAWFNGTASINADNLPWNARLREYTVANTALSSIGTCCEQVSLIDGLSRPTTIKAGMGNDIAFALSYAESADFLSIYHFMRGPIANQPSSPIAVANYLKVNIPAVHLYCMWLRSVGDCPNTAAAVCANIGTYPGRVFQNDLKSGNVYTYGFVYPALWVDSSIFVSTGTIINWVLDKETGAVLSSETSIVPAPGNYGPIVPPPMLPGWTIEWDPTSDPTSGYINAGETKNIRWLASRPVAKATINVLHIDYDNFVVLDIETLTVDAGAYGPIPPKSYPGFGAGQLILGSAPASGTIAAGETRTIIYGYNKTVVAVNKITVIHQSTTGQVLAQEEYTVPLGNYGPYDSSHFANFSNGFWDPTSAPISGVITANGTNLTIRYLYIPITIA